MVVVFFVMVVVFFVMIVVFIVMFVVVMVLVLVMLVLVLAMELATAHIVPMNPFVIFVPMSGYPHPIVTIIPIERTLVIRPITQLDRDGEPHGAWPDHQANRQESHYQNRKFCFHSCNQLFV